MTDLPPPLYLALPPPISTNNIYGNRKDGKGRSKTPEYSAWVARAMVMIGAQKRRNYTCPVCIVLFVGEAGVGNMDSDNALKAPIDALKVARVIQDDSRKWVRSSQSVWVPAMSGMVACISPASAPPLAATVVSLVPDALRELLRPNKPINILEAKL